MSSLASYSLTCMFSAKDPGLALKGHQQVRVGGDLCRAALWALPAPLPKSLFLFLFISTRQSKEPGMHWGSLPVSCFDLFVCINEPAFQKRVNPLSLKGH